MRIPPQIVTSGSTLENLPGPPKTVSWAIKLEGLDFNASGGFCGHGGTSGSVTGRIHLKGYADASRTKQVGFFIG
jgi:hypothetical protein